MSTIRMDTRRHFHLGGDFANVVVSVYQPLEQRLLLLH